MQAVTSSRPKLLFVYNPHAGKGLIRPHLSDVLVALSASYDVSVHPTTAAGDALSFTAAHAGDYDLIVGSGGDGTLHEVVNGIMQLPESQRPPIGYVPAGSTNDFAISHAIPKTMVESAHMITSGLPHHFDLGAFGNEYFTYVAAFGSFTDITYDTPQDIKNVYGHMAYIMEGARRLPNYRPQHLKVTADGEMIEGDFIVGMVANSTSVAGFKLPYTDISLRDGVSELILIRMTNSLDLFPLLGQVLNNDFNSDRIIYRKVKSVTFESENPISWTLDGEYGGTYTSVTASNVPRAVRFICEKA